MTTHQLSGNPIIAGTGPLEKITMILPHFILYSSGLSCLCWAQGPASVEKHFVSTNRQGLIA